MNTTAALEPIDRTVQVVGRPAVDTDAEHIAALFERAGSVPPTRQPVAAVVALADGSIVGAALASPAGTDGGVAAAVAVDRFWHGLGIPTFLGKLLGCELTRRGVHEVLPPRIS